jgi:hypothetical protein
MARPKIKRKGIDWKALLMSEEKDLLKSAVQEMVRSDGVQSNVPPVPALLSRC